MAPEKAPAFQFYPKDFLTDQHVMAMTLPECGAYIKLLCSCWQEQTLPADPKQLARLLMVTPTAFARLWPALEPCFRVDPDDASRLIHPRLEKERAKQDAYRSRQANAGRASAASRLQPETNHGSTTVQPDTQPNPSLLSSVSDLPSPVKEKTNTARAFPVNGTTDPDIGERAAKFLERYPELYREHRHGARFLPKPALDWPTACELVQVWPDDRLEKLAIVFLKTDHEFASNGSRTIRQFAALASWCDDRLRQVETERAR